jgi:hypothetical protein
MKATVEDMTSNKPRCVGYVWLILYLFRNADQNSIQLCLGLSFQKHVMKTFKISDKKNI